MTPKEKSQPTRSDGPLRPWGEPSADQQPPQDSQPGPRSRRSLWSALFVVLLVATYGVSAYQDLSSPAAWAYWKDLYFSPQMTAQAVRLGGRNAIAVRGQIGAAAASWFRDRLDEAKLSAGDVVFLSSPGGRLDQGLIMGEIIRSRGLTTVVAKVDGEGRPQPSYCASACVFAFAGGKVREAFPGSALGVHQFSSEMSKGGDPGRDIVAETQRTTGMILEYMTRMGVAPSIMEQMSASKDIRWLDARQAFDLKLVTNRYAGS